MTSAPESPDPPEWADLIPPAPCSASPAPRPPLPSTSQCLRSLPAALPHTLASRGTQVLLAHQSGPAFTADGVGCPSAFPLGELGRPSFLSASVSSPLKSEITLFAGRRPEDYWDSVCKALKDSGWIR